MILAGVDGCRSGWVVVSGVMRGSRLRDVSALVVSSFEAVADVVAERLVVDIPIGLLDAHVTGGRECDRVARAILGKPRRSSVFTPPIRPVLSAVDYQDARRIQPMTRQTFNILPKVAEVDRLMSSEQRSRIHEGHPEITFWALAGAPMAHRKKSLLGQAERLSLVKMYLDVPADARGCGLDDLIDACAMLLSAARLMEGRALLLTNGSRVDSAGLTMDICA